MTRVRRDEGDHDERELVEDDSADQKAGEAVQEAAAQAEPRETPAVPLEMRFDCVPGSQTLQYRWWDGTAWGEWLPVPYYIDRTT